MLCHTVLATRGVMSLSPRLPQGLVARPKKAWLSLPQMEAVQCSADHVAVLWCGQFVDLLAKAVVGLGVSCGNIGFDAAQLATLPASIQVHLHVLLCTFDD